MIPETLDVIARSRYTWSRQPWVFYWSTGYPALSVFSSLRQNPAVDCFFFAEVLYMSKKKKLYIQESWVEFSFFSKKTNRPFPNVSWRFGNKNPSGFRWHASSTFFRRLPVDPTFAADDCLVNVDAPPWKNAVGKTGKSTRREGWGGDLSSCWCFLKVVSTMQIYIHTLHSIYRFVSWNSGSRYLNIFYLVNESILAYCWDTYPHHVKW